MKSQPQTMTEEAWLKLGTLLFGDDRKKWQFKCPSCGLVLSGEAVKERFDCEIKAGRLEGYSIEQECIGRYVDKVDCDWAAYGLFRGPNFVDRGSESPVAVFPYAPTHEKDDAECKTTS